MITFKHLIQEHSDLFIEIQGPLNQELFLVQPPELAKKNEFCFISSHKHLEAALQNISSCKNWVIQEKFLNTISKNKIPTDVAIIACKNLQVAMAIALKYFDFRKNNLPFVNGISSQTFIHPTSKLGKGVTVAPFVVIGPNVTIGENTIIGPNCTIEGNVYIGSNCWLESHVFLGSNTQVGSHCQFQPFATIGSDGYGFAPTKDDVLKIPQIGKVVLEDFVHVGANTCIDKATLTETRIGKGTKFDNLVHIAHNCTIGKYCLITAGFATAGSTVIGDHFICGGQVAVSDHLHISSNVTLAGGTTVTSHIEVPGAYGGTPAMPMNDYLRAKASIPYLPQLRKQMSKVLKHLGLEDEKK